VISVEDAISLILDNISVLKVSQKKVSDTLGFVVSQDVISPINVPSFRQSAMDGYAVCISENNNYYHLIGEIATGKSADDFHLKPGEAVRIFTGAAVPESADGIGQQEIANIQNNQIYFSKTLKSGENIRSVGEQIRAGDIALIKNSIINPAAVGFLYMLGITEIAVYEKPSLAVIATGSELVKPGMQLTSGKIYESNSFMIHAALKQAGFDKIDLMTIADDYKTTVTTIQNALEKRDVVIITGGISVGDYDFVGRALQEIGVNEIFYKVKQKPGKPLFFGKWKGKYVFALPGNPAAALTSFYVYVLKSLDMMSGKQLSGLDIKLIPLATSFTKKGDRALFLKAAVENNIVNILEGQNSAMLKSFAFSNALAYIASEKNEISKGELIPVYLLPR
jgi:molybdopterin molybdotransferase